MIDVKVESVQDLFLHELSDLYDGTQKIALILLQLVNEVDNERVRSVFQEHERETIEQIETVERCFEILGTQPKRMMCCGVHGLKEEHQNFVKNSPPKKLLTMFDLGAVAKAEHYAIASYRTLIEKANLMGQQECTRLLQKNLEQEEAMARRVEQLGRELGQQTIPEAVAAPDMEG
ncbi:MAG: ferritin-like domain-containing protein [Ardenticatenaceae bacterium]|nr:ferritin-like domain-containing protein [Ardenticatenaceae bacterium]HBY97438.1 hypothetical protein [Chloroflexota bacterium]